jgi:hypothetical protein
MAEEKDQGDLSGMLLKDLSPDQMRKLLKSEFEQFLPLAFRDALERIGYTGEIAGLVQLLAARSNDAKEEVLQKALTLYGLALDAREKGNRLAILSPDDVIVHDVIGFEPVGTAISILGEVIEARRPGG